MSRDCHSDPARASASWVLPLAAAHSPSPSAVARAGTRTVVVPAASVPVSPGAVSGRALYPSAGGGTGPMRTGPDGGEGTVTAGPPARTCDS